MPKKARISFTTNPIVPVVSAKDDEHCNEIHTIAGKLKRRYHFMILSINKPIENFDRTTYPSSFVLCPKFLEDKSHFNWSKTKFNLYYVNTGPQDGYEVASGYGCRQLLKDATPLKTRRMLELLLVFAEIEEAEDATCRWKVKRIVEE